MTLSPELFYLLEAAVFMMFLLHIAHAWRRGRRQFLELVSAVIYGYILEQGDIALFKTYSYNPDLHGFIGFVPLIMPLSWAMIIYGSMLISDRLGLPTRAAPFADALWAVLLDLGLDAIAIRIGLWQWNIPLDQGYFGVPAGNFYSWIFVAFFFSLFTRFARGRGLGWQWTVPFLAYPSFLLSLTPFVLVSEGLYENPAPRGLGIELVSLTIVIFVAIIGSSLKRRKLPQAGDFLTTITRWGIHLSYLGTFLWMGLYDSLPFLLFMGLLLLAVEALLVLVLPPQGVPILSRRRAVSVAAESSVRGALGPRIESSTKGG